MVLDFSSKKNADESVEQIVLFKLDGVEHSIPNKARMNVALKYLKKARDESENDASLWLLETLLTPEGFDALTDYDDLSPEEFQQVVTLAAKTVLGELQNPKAQ